MSVTYEAMRAAARREVSPKDPDAVVPYAFDWSDWLGAATISTSAWEVPVGLTEDSDSATTTVATVVLSGGTAGAEYVVRNTVTTSDSRTDVRSMVIRVAER